MSTVVILMGVLAALWFWRTGRISAVWDAMTGSAKIVA
jgi:hypothetical protein